MTYKPELVLSEPRTILINVLTIKILFEGKLSLQGSSINVDIKAMHEQPIKERFLREVSYDNIQNLECKR